MAPTDKTWLVLIRKRLAAANFLRAKLDYLAKQIVRESEHFSEALRHREFPKLAVPLNMVKTGNFSLTITVNSVLSSSSEPVPLLFALDSFCKDLRGYLEFITRAILLSRERDDGRFSYENFLNHVCSPKAGQNSPIWLAECLRINPDFVDHVQANEAWLRRLTSLRTALTHFQIQFNVGGSSQAVWEVGTHVVIKEPEDWQLLGPPQSQDVRVLLEGEEVHEFVATSLVKLDTYRVSASALIRDVG